MHVGERVGPFVVVANESTIPARKRRVVVRCVVCERVSEMNERSLLDKRTEEQRGCAKCRVYTTNGTWVKGWKAKMESAAAEANRLNEENARLRDEIDKVMRERDEWRDKFHALNQTAGELCNACGWAFMIPGEPCRCEVVKERDEARAEVEKLSESAKAAWEAECVMREQRDRYHAEWKQERQEVERLKAEADRWKRSCNMFRERDWPHAFQVTVTSLEREVSDAHVQLARLRRLSKPWEGDAYRRGAEAMRKHIAEVAGRNAALEWVVELVRALPIPEEP